MYTYMYIYISIYKCLATCFLPSKHPYALQKEIAAVSALNRRERAAVKHCAP